MLAAHWTRQGFLPANRPHNEVSPGRPAAREPARRDGSLPSQPGTERVRASLGKRQTSMEGTPARGSCGPAPSTASGPRALAQAVHVGPGSEPQWMWCEVSQASRGDEPKKWGLCLKPLPGPCPLCSVRMTGPSPLPGRHCVPGLLGQEGPFRGWSHGIAAPGPGPEPPCLSLSPVLTCSELPPAPGTVLLSWTCHHMPGSLGLEKGEHVVTWETSRVSSQESGHERLGGGSPTSGSFSPTGLFFSLWCSDRQSACHSPQGLAVSTGMPSP